MEVSAALLSTNAVQYLLLALPITPAGVPPVSMLPESSFLPLLSVGISVHPHVCIRLGSAGGLGSPCLPFRDRNVLPFPFSGVLPI